VKINIEGFWWIILIFYWKIKINSLDFLNCIIKNNCLVLVYKYNSFFSNKHNVEIILGQYLTTCSAFGMYTTINKMSLVNH